MQTQRDPLPETAMDGQENAAKSKAQEAPDSAGPHAPATVKAGDKVPYSYVTEGGEKYHVVAVSYKNNTRVETGNITFGNGARNR